MYYSFEVKYKNKKYKNKNIRTKLVLFQLKKETESLFSSY